MNGKMQLAPSPMQSERRRKGRLPKLPVGRIYSPEEIITAASIYVEECELKEQNAVKALSDYRGESPHREQASLLHRDNRTCSPINHKTGQDMLQCSICGPQIRRKQDGLKWRKVPRRQRLYEGNFYAWLDQMTWMLTKLGIWKHTPLPPDLASDKAERFAVDEDWAVSLMLMHVNPYFLTTLRIPHTISSCELLSKLARVARPFRFQDLPSELRTRVYEYMVPVDRQYDEMTRHYTRTACIVDGIEAFTRTSIIRRLATIRKLCAVSQEFRKHVSRIHYSRNTFISCDDDGQGPELVAKWAETMGEGNLHHLCNVQLTFEYHPKGFFDGFIATLDSSGLRAKAIQCVDYDFDSWDDGILERVLPKKKQTRDKASDGADVVDFFLSNPQALRSEFYPTDYRPFAEHEDDGGYYLRPFNERNAYSVAYGECYTECPW